MSKFVKAVLEAMPRTPEQKEKEKNMAAGELAQKAVKDKTATPGQIALDAEIKKRTDKARLGLKSKKKRGKVVEQEEEPVAPAEEPAVAPVADAPAAEEPPPLTSEGEAHILDQARLALHVNLNSNDLVLTPAEQKAIYRPVTPETAIQFGEMLAVILEKSPDVAAGARGESFNSRIDPLLDSLKKN